MVDHVLPHIPGSYWWNSWAAVWVLTVSVGGMILAWIAAYQLAASNFITYYAYWGLGASITFTLWLMNLWYPWTVWSLAAAFVCAIGPFLHSLYVIHKQDYERKITGGK